MAGVFTKIKDKIINVWNTLKTKTTEIWKDIKNNAIIKPINGIISAINGMLSGVGDGINGMINALNSIHFDIPDWVPGLGGKSFSFNLSNITMPKIPMLEVSAYAMGGFPEDGFFYANHNELVGKFSNGRTAVANNEQITTGIEEAAYRGMMRALAESRENENQDAIVSLLSEQNNMLANGEVRAVMDTREALAALRTQAKRNGYVFST